MIQKTLGYVLALLGLAGLVISSEGARKVLSLELPGVISNSLILVISLAVVAAGLALSLKGVKPKQPEEVPIYEGKNVVGYRRMKK